MKLIAISALLVLSISTVSATGSSKNDSGELEEPGPFSPTTTTGPESPTEGTTTEVEVMTTTTIDEIATTTSETTTTTEAEMTTTNIVEMTTTVSDTSTPTSTPHIPRLAINCQGTVFTVPADNQNLWDLAKLYDVDFEGLKSGNMHLAPSFDLIHKGDEICVVSDCEKFSGPETNPYPPHTEEYEEEQGENAYGGQYASLESGSNALAASALLVFLLALIH
jgi:hypothetical protein